MVPCRLPLVKIPVPRIAESAGQAPCGRVQRERRYVRDDAPDVADVQNQAAPLRFTSRRWK